MNFYIKKNTITTLSGANGSGKTNLIRYMILSFQASSEPFEYIFIMSNTASFSGDFLFLEKLKHTMKYGYTINSPDNFERDINLLLDIQKKNKFRVLVIFDDIMSLSKQNKTLKVLTSQQRHFNITILFSIQVIKEAATFMREISSYDIIYDLKTELSLKACYTNYFFTEYRSLAAFCEEFCKKLNKYEFFFVDRYNNKKDIMIAPLIGSR